MMRVLIRAVLTTVLLLSLFNSVHAQETAAEQIVKEYLEALVDGNCLLALELRPEYTGCAQIELTGGEPAIEEVLSISTATVVSLDFKFDKNGKSGFFKGFLLVAPSNNARGLILEQSSFFNADSLESYLNNTELIEKYRTSTANLRAKFLTQGRTIEPAEDPAALESAETATPDATENENSSDDGSTVRETEPAGQVENDTELATGPGDVTSSETEEFGLNLYEAEEQNASPQNPPSDSESELYDEGNAEQRKLSDGDTTGQEPSQVVLDQPVSERYCPPDCGQDVASGLPVPMKRPPTPERVKRAPSAPPPPETFVDAANIPALETAGGVWPGRHGFVFGSQSLRDACFSAAALAHRKGENRSDRKSPKAFMLPPVQRRPHAANYKVPKQMGLSIRSVNTKGRKVVALGFDIGEQNNDFAGYDGRIIDYLRQQNVKATLYMGGKWMLNRPERSMQLIADPLFEMANHAWTHGNFRLLDTETMKNEVYYTEVAYEVLRAQLLNRPCAQSLSPDIAETVPPRLMTFRFPYGTCRAESIDIVNDAGMPAVQWDTVTADPARNQSAGAIARALINMKPGGIAVLHANGRGWNTAAALRIAIPEMKRRNFEFVTVAELLQMGEPVARKTCYEVRPGDNLHYDRIFGRGTGD